MPDKIILWKCGGPRYVTRNGKLAAVSESNAEIVNGEWQSFWQGNVEGVYTEWNLDGTHRGGNTDLDLVRAEVS